jgi:hypothetical protein
LNELFDNREKLITFLKSEYGNNKEKLFGSVIDLKKLLQEIRSDDSVISKIKRPKPESFKSCMLLYNSVPKFELFEPVKDNDFEIIGKFKKSLIECSESEFIDDLIFCKMDNLCNIKTDLVTIEDFLAVKIFDVIHNIYTEKNAIELMNEENNKKNDHKNKKKGKKTKKKRGNSVDNSSDEKLIEEVKTTPIVEGGIMSWRKKPAIGICSLI